MNKFKTVSMKVAVPVGDYCWDGKVCCNHLMSDGFSFPICMLGFYALTQHPDPLSPKKFYYEKSPICKGLPETDGGIVE